MNTDDLAARFPEFREAWFPADDDDHLDFQVRIMNTWDEVRYRRMLATAHDVLDRLPASEISTGAWDGIFDRYLDGLIQLLRNPVVLTPESFDPPPADHRAHIEERVAELQALRSRFLALRGGGSGSV